MEFDFSFCTSKKIHNIVLTNIGISVIPTELFTHCFNNEMTSTETMYGRYTFIER